MVTDLAEVRKADRPPRLIAAKPRSADADRPAFEGKSIKDAAFNIPPSGLLLMAGLSSAT